jgi:hypothetical protein
MTAVTEDIVARNLDVVQQHFHNETPELIDVAMELYGDTITWEIPARGLCLQTHAEVRQAYLDLFNSVQVHRIVNINRWGAGNMVFDDAIFEFTITGDGYTNAPFPKGTRCSMRLTHTFEFNEEGKIVRENGYEIWRRAEDKHLINDDIPADALIAEFD